MNLYQITNEYLQAFDALSTIEDITPDVIEDTLSSTKGEFEDKALNMAAYIKNLESEKEAMKEYEHAMQERRRRHERKIESLKEYLAQNLIAVDVKKVKSAELDISLRVVEQGSVEADESILDDEWFREKTIKTVAKDLIAQALKDGREITGAKFIPSVSVVIK